MQASYTIKLSCFKMLQNGQPVLETWFIFFIKFFHTRLCLLKQPILCVQYYSNEFGLLFFLYCHCHTTVFILSRCIELHGDSLNWKATCVVIVYGIIIISTAIITVLFFSLTLQPIVVVFSEPESGL